MIVMYLDNARSLNPKKSCTSALRLAGYRASVVEHGLQWGGPENSVFFKDLKLMPGCGANGERIDCRNGNLLSVAMNLREQVANEIQRRNIQPAVRLPRAWAAFRAGAARRVPGEGPEFEQACCKAGSGEYELIHQTMRRFEGLRLIPVDWVGAELRNAMTVFVESASFPRLQVVRIEDPQTDLMGYEGANSFDFYHSRYRH
jgi:hypothetical protein